MKGSRLTLALVVALALAACISGAVVASEVSEGQVVAVQEWTLFIRTADNTPLSFSPHFVQTGTSWAPAPPVRTLFPALEPGEMVRVTWTMDEREGRRRVDAITVISAREGTMQAIVKTASREQLVVRPKDEPGTVTLNPRFVQVEGKWGPDPVVAAKLAQLRANAQITGRWAWDNEGRKRIVDVTEGW